MDRPFSLITTLKISVLKFLLEELNSVNNCLPFIGDKEIQDFFACRMAWKKYRNVVELGAKASAVQTTTNACMYPHPFGCNWVGATLKSRNMLD